MFIEKQKQGAGSRERTECVLPFQLFRQFLSSFLAIRAIPEPQKASSLAPPRNQSIFHAHYKYMFPLTTLTLCNPTPTFNPNRFRNLQILCVKFDEALLNWYWWWWWWFWRWRWRRHGGQYEWHQGRVRRPTAAVPEDESDADEECRVAE